MPYTFDDIEKQTELNLSLTALKALVERYLLRNEIGEVIELPEGMFRRVSDSVSIIENTYETKKVIEKPTEATMTLPPLSVIWSDRFYDLMTSQKFIPNSPTLMNAGTELGQLAACFVLPVEDSMWDIFESLKVAALIHQSGGGVGFSFSKVRSSRDMIRTTKTLARGPMTFINVYNAAAETVKQAGKRFGANMAVLRVDHPDIISFITMKNDPEKFTSFNISVGFTDEFMNAVLTDSEYALISPLTGKEIDRLPAKRVFELIVRMAHKNGEPGMIFLDTINSTNTLPGCGNIEATNPCGEQPLFPYESCNLGSVNSSAHAHDGIFDWDDFETTVRWSTRFLDNVIDSNKYVPKVPRIYETAMANRKIGLGIMGFADTLIKLGIPYASEEAIEFADKVMEFITDIAFNESCRLGVDRGPFPNIDKSVYALGKMKPRNATVTTIAPTGTISIIAGCSYGIEPLMAIAWIHRILDGQEIHTINPMFVKAMADEGLNAVDFTDEIVKKVSIRHIDGIPDTIKDMFVTAHDILPEFHVKMQSVFQRHTDNAVSKTINMREAASPDDIARVAFIAWNAGCKGFTIYRNNSRPNQVFGTSKSSIEESKRDEMVDRIFKGDIEIPIVWEPDVDDEELAEELLYSDEAEVEYVSCPRDDCDHEKAVKVGSCVRCDVCGFNGCMTVG